MFKKFISILTCAVIVLSLFPFTANAAENAAFKLQLVEQTDKSVTVSFDFVSGAGFAAFDFKISFNKLKLAFVKSSTGSGYRAFKNQIEDQGQAAMSSINSNSEPINVAMFNTVPFSKQGDDGSILVLTFSKIAGAKISEGDITVKIDNCQNEKFEDINASVSYNFATVVPTVPNKINDKEPENKVDYEQGVSVKDNNNSEIGEPVNKDDKTNASDTTLQQGLDSAADKSQSEKNNEEPAINEKPNSDKVKTGVGASGVTVIIIIAAVVCVAGIGAVILIIVRNKKKPENQI